MKTVPQHFARSCQIKKYLPDTILAIWHTENTMSIELLSGNRYKRGV